MSQETFRKLRQMLMEKLDVCQELTDQEILETIDELILDSLRESGVSLKEKVQLRQELFYSVRKLDVLQELIEDETVTEIMVNGPDSIFVERKGRLTKWPKSFTDQEKLEDVIQQIVGKCNRIVNESSPIVDARLETGARVNVVIYPVALNGPILTIRRFPDKPITMEKLIELGSVTPECAEFLEKLVKARYSIVIGGGTGSGKTTFLGALSEYIPRDERIITIEDNAELKIQGIANLVRLEARAATVNGAPAVSIRDLIRSALRMRPDRIIVGEVRGGEAMDMLQAPYMYYIIIIYITCIRMEYYRLEGEHRNAMNIKYRLLCKRLIEEGKRVGVIQYYNVLFIMELLSDKDIWSLEQWVNGMNNLYMKDIHNWCRLHFIKYHTVFVYMKEYPVKANIWNGYSYIRWRMERRMNLG